MKKQPTYYVSNFNEIGAYLHCKLCLKEILEQHVSASPRDYARLEVGWTRVGLQVWCVRHDCNVIHIDFEGQQHPADLTRLKPT